MWNSLPNELRKVEDFGEFRRLVHTWSGSSCKCSMCKHPFLPLLYAYVNLICVLFYNCVYFNLLCCLLGYFFILHAKILPRARWPGG